MSALTSRRLAKYFLLPRPCPSDGPLAARRNMSVNSGPITAIRTRSDNDGKTDRIGLHVALIGYARVSTANQKLSLKLDALNADGCDRIFDDHAYGAKADRTGLAVALAYMLSCDTMVAWKQIDSASCRDSGCLSESISEVAVILK